MQYCCKSLCFSSFCNPLNSSGKPVLNYSASLLDKLKMFKLPLDIVRKSSFPPCSLAEKLRKLFPDVVGPGHDREAINMYYFNLGHFLFISLAGTKTLFLFRI